MFKGRYGSDRLSFAIIVIAVALSLVSFGLGFVAFAVSYALSILSFLLVAFALFRAFSRNFPARQRELHKYMELEYKLASFIKRVIPRSGNAYRYFACPKCKQRLRVPRGKGKVRITCSKCSHQFEKRT